MEKKSVAQNKSKFGLSEETIEIVKEEGKSGLLQAAELFSQEGLLASFASIYALIANVYGLIASRKKDDIQNLRNIMYFLLIYREEHPNDQKITALLANQKIAEINSKLSTMQQTEKNALIAALKSQNEEDFENFIKTSILSSNLSLLNRITEIRNASLKLSLECMGEIFIGIGKGTKNDWDRQIRSITTKKTDIAISSINLFAALYNVFTAIPLLILGMIFRSGSAFIALTLAGIIFSSIAIGFSVLTGTISIAKIIRDFYFLVTGKSEEGAEFQKELQTLNLSPMNRNLYIVKAFFTRGFFSDLSISGIMMIAGVTVGILTTIGVASTGVGIGIMLTVGAFCLGIYIVNKIATKHFDKVRAQALAQAVASQTSVSSSLPGGASLSPNALQGSLQSQSLAPQQHSASSPVSGIATSSSSQPSPPTQPLANSSSLASPSASPPVNPNPAPASPPVNTNSNSSVT